MTTINLDTGKGSRHMTALRKLLGVTTALALVQTVPAFAQTGGESGQSGSASDPGDIIVTARRYEERLQDVPISITVFNQEQLASRNVVNAQDLAAYTPSLSANSNLGSQNSTFAIRGFVQDPDTAPSVGVYFADVVAPRGAANQIPVGDGAGPGSFFDLQNVQVLKGPQGTLFGRNTTGGAILLVPQKPTDKLEGFVEGSYGNYDMKRIQGVINIPLGETARFRIGADHQVRDGFLKNDSGFGPSRFNDINYTAVRASLVANFTPELENYMIVSYSRSNTAGDLKPVIACNATQSQANFLGLLACGQLAQNQARGAGFYTVQNQLADPQTLLTQWQIINTTTWQASENLTVKNIVSYAQLQEKLRSALFGTNFFLAPGVPIVFAQSVSVPGSDSANQATFTEEFQLQGDDRSGKFHWQAGAFLLLSDPIRTGMARSPILLSCIDPDTFNCTNPIGAGSMSFNSSRNYFRNVGLYAQGTYSLTDQLKLTGGFRYTWDRQRNETSLKTFRIPTPGVGVVAFCTNSDLVAPDCNVTYRQNSQAPTWLVDLDYKPTNDILLYVKYSRGYRSGGIAAAGPTQFATFRPEKVDSFEGGIKTTLLSPVKGTFNVSAFYNNFTNQQTQVGFLPKPGASVGPVSGVLNAGKSRIYGFEVEASLTPFTGLRLDGSYAHLNTKIESITITQPPASSPYILAPLAEPGRPLALSPRDKFSISGSYTLPLDSSVGDISFGATFTYTGRQIVSYSNLNSTYPGISALGTLAPRNLLNLNASWNGIAGTPIDLQFFATNVTKQKYYTYVSGLFGAGGFETAQIGDPRMYGARLRFHFGQ
jgi:iron complex outermembrane receptor protein